MIWLINQFPELNCLEPAQRQQLLRGTWWTYAWMLARALATAMFVAPLAALGMSGVVGKWGGSFQAIVPPTDAEFAAIAGVALLSATAMATGVYFTQLGRIRRAMRKEIATAFRGRRPPFCMRCGYDLRGSVSGRCPECGGEFL